MTVGTAIRWWKLDYFRVAWVGGGGGGGHWVPGAGERWTKCQRARDQGRKV